MAVFISHSFENKAEFDNIADALETDGIQYWKPESLKAGASLAEQLRSAITEAEVCIFVATRHSVSSNWCGAEIGAFWGAGKPVVIYVAEASLDDAQMPKQFQGHLFERRISRVVTSVKAHLAASQASQERRQVVTETALVSAMSRSELDTLVGDAVQRIQEAVERVQDVSFVATTLSKLAKVFLNLKPSSQANDPESREIRESLSSLIGVSDVRMLQGAKNSGTWSHSFSFSTDTGDWSGLALRYEPHENDRARVWFYKECIVWRASSAQRIETIALLSVTTDHDHRGIVSLSVPLLVVGRGGIGAIKSG